VKKTETKIILSLSLLLFPQADVFITTSPTDLTILSTQSSPCELPPPYLPHCLREGSSVAITGAEKTVQILDMKTWKSRTKWRTPCKYEGVHLMRSLLTQSDPQVASTRERLYVAGRDNEVLLCEIPLETTGTGAQKKRKRAQSNAVAKLSAGNGEGEVVQVEELEPTSTSPLVSGSLSNVSKLRLSHHRGVRAEASWCGLDITTTEEGPTVQEEDGEGGETEEKRDQQERAMGDRIVGLCSKGKLYIIENSERMRVACDDQHGERQQAIGEPV
jgi:hypothetical protein